MRCWSVSYTHLDVYKRQLLPLAATPRKARLLVVDDQPIHLQVLYRALSGDHQLFMATSGAQALKVVREQTPDLVLLDVVMPDMDGFEAVSYTHLDVYKRQACWVS